MRKLIAFSLWGDNPKYCVGAIKNAQLRSQYYPDWICKFYVHEDVPIDYIIQLREIENVEIVICCRNADWKFTTERFCAIDEEDVSHVIFRDTDSRLNQREADAVNQWIKEDTAIHVMKDHPYHGSFPILAGMWGINKSKFPFNMEESLVTYEAKKVSAQYYYGQYYYDQIFLNNYIWPNFYQDSTIHDEFFTKNDFPNKRVGDQFVGQSFDENDNTPTEHIQALKIS